MLLFGHWDFYMANSYGDLSYGILPVAGWTVPTEPALGLGGFGL